MRTRAVVLTAALSFSLASFAHSAFAQPDRRSVPVVDVEGIKAEPQYTFCQKPRRPLDARQRELCPLAADVRGCEGFAAACRGDAPKGPTPQYLEEPRSNSVATILAGIARTLVWLFLALAIGALAYPLVAALLRARRDKKLAEKPPVRSVTMAVVPDAPAPEAISDAEAALRDADEAARRGNFVRAMSLYLAASLAALDRRGAIRLARHRTNGEYVRFCTDDEARQPLREIVREVDKVEFGKVSPTADAVARVASRASSLVRAIAIHGTTLAFVVLFVGALAGCSETTKTARGFDDPAGDELPMEVMRRHGYAPSYLRSSIAALPMPTSDAAAPIIVVDTSRVALEDESEVHLLRWVQQGGVLVLFGHPREWPSELGATETTATAHDLDIVTEDTYARGARIAAPRGVTWRDAEGIAFLDKQMYAARFYHGAGMVLGVAGAELFTNVGVARPDNAIALVALLDIAAQERTASAQARGVEGAPTTFDVHVARAQDGVPPPSNPMSALVQAGLGKGMWHALAAALVLFVAYGVRHARARPEAPALRRAFAEHVEATGAFYGRARALGHALASYFVFAEMRLRERVPRGGDPVAFLAARANVPLEEAARIWKRAQEASADDPPRGDELTTIRDLRALLIKALDAG